MKRLFLALTPEFDDARALWESWEIFRISSPRIRWLPPEMFHITLLFFGECEEEHLTLIADKMDRAGDSFSSLYVETTGPGQFPPGGRPRVFVETLRDASGGLEALHSQLYSGLKSRFHLESRKFRPHITMARLSRYSGSLQFHQRPVYRFPLERMVLYESVLYREGAEYTPVFTAPLKG